MNLDHNRNFSSSSSCARSVADIGNHGLPIFSVFGSPDKLIFWGSLFPLHIYSDCLCILYVDFLCLWYVKSFNLMFAFLIHQLLFICPKNCSCLFLMVLSRDLLYPAMSITSLFDFISVHDILIILLMYHISAASSLLSRSFISVHIHA